MWQRALTAFLGLQLLVMMGSGGCLGAMVHRLDCLRYLFAIYFLDLDVAIRAMKCCTSHLSTNSVNEELLLRTVPRLVTFCILKNPSRHPIR
jgi:hypothetical protein